MKNKWLMLVLAGMMAVFMVGFTGCGDSGSDGAATDDTVSEETAAADDSASEEQNVGDIIKEQVSKEAAARYGEGDSNEFNEVFCSMTYGETDVENEYTVKGSYNYPLNGERYDAEFEGMCTVVGTTCTTHDMDWGEAVLEED